MKIPNESMKNIVSRYNIPEDISIEYTSILSRVYNIPEEDLIAIVEYNKQKNINYKQRFREYENDLEYEKEL